MSAASWCRWGSLGLVLIGPCGRQPAGLSPVLPTQRIYYDDRPPAGQFRDSTRLVIRDAQGWDDVWTRATAAQSPRPEQPVIDFGREFVLVVGAGRLSPGDQVRVDSVGTRGKYFVAVVRTILACQRFPGDAYPLEIVKVPKTKKNVTFDERRERAQGCQ